MYPYLYIFRMGTLKKIVWIGSSREDLSAFPKSVKRMAGEQLMRLQNGLVPIDSKSMTSIGVGVFEIRIRTASGAYRVIFATVIKGSVAVLHCFKKNSQKTTKRDLDLSSRRYAELRKL